MFVVLNNKNCNYIDIKFRKIKRICISNTQLKYLSKLKLIFFSQFLIFFVNISLKKINSIKIYVKYTNTMSVVNINLNVLLGVSSKLPIIIKAAIIEMRKKESVFGTGSADPTTYIFK